MSGKSRRGWISALLALFAVVTGFGLATVFVGLIAVGGIVGWFLMSPSPQPVARLEAAPILVDGAWDEGGFQEPIRREWRRERRRARAVVMAPSSVSSDADVAGTQVAEAAAVEVEPIGTLAVAPTPPQAPAPSVDRTPPPALDQAVRALQARMASGQLAVREGEAGRVSLAD